MMKKVLRSWALKMIVSIVCLVCIAMVVYIGFGTIADIVYGDEQFVYGLERSFEDSSYIGNQLHWEANRLDHYIQENRIEEITSTKSIDNISYFIARDQKTYGDANLQKTYPNLDKEYYYIYATKSTCDTNVSVGNNYFMQDYEEYYEEEGIDEFGKITWQSGSKAIEKYKDDDVIIVAIKKDDAMLFQSLWEKQKEQITELLQKELALITVSLFGFIYLLLVCGRKPEDDEVHLMLIDRMFVELTVTAIIIIALAMIAFAIAVGGDGIVANGLNKVLIWIPTISTALGAALLGTLTLSLVRNMKNRTFFERSLCMKCCKWIWKKCKEIIGGIRNTTKRMMRFIGKNYHGKNIIVICFAFCVILSAIACIFGVTGEFIYFLIGVIFVIAGLFFVYKRIAGFGEIVEGLRRMRIGEISYKIPSQPDGVLQTVAEDINSIGDGMQTALQNEIRAERMKSELITNVSHDLKTPLTSILNYSELLCKEHLSPEEANDYAKIIQEKGNRLKNLTSDLFDISKVQSGAETVDLEQIDACTLVRQVLGEQDSAINEAGLLLKTIIPEQEMIIFADGKKLSRVLDNLIGNCVKYALQGTRVFVSVAQENNDIVIELKNTANYEMDFGPDEITERFVRGDTARSTEGSGLGLAIAKSYVIASGGRFEVDVDGDLFKVRIQFIAV